MRKTISAAIALALLAGTGMAMSSGTEPAVAADAFNPNNFDTAKIMNAIVDPKPDLITIGYHRGAHALVDGSYPDIAENSMKSIEIAAKDGYEMLEIDVKETSDHVPVLSHDLNWGREATYTNPADPTRRLFDPFVAKGNAENDARNPQVASLTWNDIKSAQLRNSVNFKPSSETVASLQQSLDYMTTNKIAMVLSLDIRSAEIAKAAWPVIYNSKDYLGRSYAESTLFKIPGKAFRTTNDFKAAFGSNYRSVYYQPVYNTSDLVRDTFGDGRSGEQPVIDHFLRFRSDGTIRIAATEVQMKETGGILTGLLAQAKKKQDGSRASASIFSPSVDYYEPGDTAKQDPKLFTSEGYCCTSLQEFLFNKDKQYPDLPSDTKDERGSFEWIKSMGFSSVTADLAPGLDANLNRDGLRNITYMQGNYSPGADPLPSNPTPGRTSVRSPDPSAIEWNGQYYSVEMQGGRIVGRVASSLERLQDDTPSLIYSDTNLREVWAPELVHVDGVFHVYFSAGAGTAHRMHVISSSTFETGKNWGVAQQLRLPDDKWAIDGAPFTYAGERWFVWSGWEGNSDGEQTLYIARMTSPTTTTGARFVISQPREAWERVGGGPFVNEGPQPVVDPDGQLHVVYSARHSWQADYCLADLRLKRSGDPTKVFDWYKSNGCLFGSDSRSMQKGWAPTLYSNGPGHHSFVLSADDTVGSPKTPTPYPVTHRMMYHAVPKGMDYSWANRTQYVGAYTWYKDINYTRCCVAGPVADAGYSPMFFEDPRFTPNPPPVGPTTDSPRIDINAADPSVIRQGGTYTAVEASGNNILMTQATSLKGLESATPIMVWSDAKNLGEVWAPELEYIDGRYYIYFSAGRGDAHRMYVTSSTSIDRGFFDQEKKMNLPDRWAVDGMSFSFDGKRYFVWSGRAGSANDEQNLYMLPMSSPTAVQQSVGSAPIISQPRETWEKVTGGTNGFPLINEAPQAIKDPSGQLHIVYSANGSWSDQYCMADLRLKKGGNPLKVYDYYKSNGCLFGSNRDTMMSGWDPTLYVDGPGHNSFVLVDGDIATSPPAGPTFPMMFHGVDKGTPYSWANRYWFTGSFTWWGDTTYTRGAGNGDTANTGWGLKFFEGNGPAG
jgi:GH43 family beta-xylosidase/glycerophosphoryl diester phosphodiesterase